MPNVWRNKEKLRNAGEQHHKKIVKIVNDLINNHFNRNSIYVSKYSLNPAQMNKLYIYQKKHGVEKLIDSIFENEHMLIPETIEQDKDLRERINQFNFGLFYNEIFRKLDIKQSIDKPTVTSCIKYLSGILNNRLCDYNSWEFSKDVRNATSEMPTNEDKIKFFEEYAHPHAKELPKGSEYNVWYIGYMNISHEFMQNIQK